MIKFSKTTTQKLRLHLQQIQTAELQYKKNYPKYTEKTYYHNKTVKKKKTLAEALLIETLFLNLKVVNLLNSQNKDSLKVLRQVLLNNKKIFINSKAYDKTYVKDFRYSNKLLNLIDNFYLIEDKLNLLYQSRFKNFKLNLLRQIKTKANLIEQRIINFYKFLINDILGKWYIYLSRIFIISIIHFVPFIQLSNVLFYNIPNRNIIDSSLSYLLNFIPFLVPLLNFTMSTVTHETFSFLAIGFYFQLFVVYFKKYKISRKIAYQGTFALVSMLYYYSMFLTREIITFLYKFIKRFFFLKKFEKIELLRDDVTFYLEDLEELREYKEDFIQLGESVFSLDDITKSTNIWQFNTLFSLIGIIALLYNCMYFILRGKRPIIPVVTKTVRRMMIDRNSNESQ